MVGFPPEMKKREREPGTDAKGKAGPHKKQQRDKSKGKPVKEAEAAPPHRQSVAKGSSHKGKKQRDKSSIVMAAMAEVADADETAHRTSAEMGAFHTLFKRIARCTDDAERLELDAQLAAMGGLHKYQQVRSKSGHDARLTPLHSCSCLCPARRRPTSTPLHGCSRCGSVARPANATNLVARRSCSSAG